MERKRSTRVNKDLYDYEIKYYYDFSKQECNRTPGTFLSKVGPTTRRSAGEL